MGQVTTVSGDVCPYCGLGAEDWTNEHVFVESLGGRLIIKVCRRCNSTIGHDIEGRLLKEGSALQMPQHPTGAGLQLRGTIGPDGPVVRHELGTSEVRFGRPVATTTDGAKRTYAITGGIEQARTIIDEMGRRFGWTPEQVEDVWSSGVVSSLANQVVTSMVSYDLSLACRLAAKVALGACWAAFGPAFVSEPLTVGLRALLWAPDPLSTSEVIHDALADTDRVLESIGPDVFRPLRPSGDVSQVVLLRARKGVAFVVHLHGWELTPAFAPVVQAPLPGERMLPVVLTDGAPTVGVRDIALELPDAVAAIRAASASG
jgi:hypothetical protein